LQGKFLLYPSAISAETFLMPWMKKTLIGFAMWCVFLSIAIAQPNTAMEGDPTAAVHVTKAGDSGNQTRHEERLGGSPNALSAYESTIASISLLIWIYLCVMRAGFWQVHLPRPATFPLLWPSVVVVVPARNEAEVVAKSLSSLLQQDYRGPYHVIVVDDHSMDNTAMLAEATARNIGQSARLTVIAARDLPADWVGKVWAQSEGLAVARECFPDARYLLLTDADIAHAPSMLEILVARAMAEQLVLTSLMVRLRCKSLAERMLIPAFVFFFAMLYPFSRVNNVGSKVAAAAGGCMLVSADALSRVGGIAVIKSALIDDCALAAKMKPLGPIRLDLAEDSYSLRRYEDWTSIWNMIARSAFTQLRYSPWLLAGTILGMVLTYIAPPVLALLCNTWLTWPALLAWLLMALVYCPMLRYHRQSLWWSPLLPLTATFYLAATLGSAWRYWRGHGGQWKGRAQAIS
jgi:hopene-associated glycosyltransferase HpnB